MAVADDERELNRILREMLLLHNLAESTEVKQALKDAIVAMNKVFNGDEVEIGGE